MSEYHVEMYKHSCMCAALTQMHEFGCWDEYGCWDFYIVKTCGVFTSLKSVRCMYAGMHIKCVYAYVNYAQRCYVQMTGLRCCMLCCKSHMAQCMKGTCSCFVSDLHVYYSVPFVCVQFVCVINSFSIQSTCTILSCMDPTLLLQSQVHINTHVQKTCTPVQANNTPNSTCKKLS
jgi:hypothetical protein